MTPATRQRGETERAYIERRSADYAAWQREQDAARLAFVGPRRPCPAIIPLSVGNYDINGNPKGEGWC